MPELQVRLAEPGPDAGRADAIDHEFQLRCRAVHRAHLPGDHAHITSVAAFSTACGFRALEEFDDPGGPDLRAALMRLAP